MIQAETQIQRAHLAVARYVAQGNVWAAPLFERLDQELRAKQNQQSTIARAISIANQGKEAA